MAYEERTVASDDTVDTVPADREVVQRVPSQTVVERRTAPRTVVTEDPVGNAFAASQMIQTIVWAIVVLVLLVVALWALHVYAHLF